ncbi:diguanylate cyclase (GGDEF) domain-containing protein [Desulfurobacterium pacificum]|uniref:Diguanylate cyclase (GGDEF) domain-containing protein n=1 Tax=Desulfurobacterium pacificum TaxID=240166 RepID=A0ABY1NB93_9BACT|nr:bifunctional diguanylate cyclase/phosphodiesterase [Desulfurobacterium pacificum]SMP05396.1 diguanylate cyclase (GGDEF) domain-containing protein [Desulfurobacterium pacificum]
MVDELTGLLSRKTFFEHLSKIPIEQSFTICLFDIDDFKFVNFTHGYTVGDKILKAVALQIQKAFKLYSSNFTIARTGADQFGVIIFDEIPKVRIEELFNRYLKLLEFKKGNDFIRLTISGGVSGGRGKGEVIFSQAENALFSAKSAGKNMITFYENFAAYDMEKFKEVRYKLVQAIKKKSIKPYFQPIVSLRTGRIFGYEVLSRIFLDTEVLSGDYVFLVADSLALTPEIDKILFLNAIKFFGEYKLFFNLSMKYFFKELNTIFEIARKYSLDLSNVIFEITESQKLLQEKTAISIFTMFKEFKAGIAVDDFGAGYSNFMYLKKFPADVVKIDGAFIKNAKNNIKDLSIVKTIVDVAKVHNLRTLAEFIEDEETYQVMKDVGVSLGQGWFIGKPSPEPMEVKINIK